MNLVSLAEGNHYIKCNKYFFILGADLIFSIDKLYRQSNSIRIINISIEKFEVKFLKNKFSYFIQRML